ncbi:MAG: cyclic nucleotide-binding domain-containing protein [Rhodospirillales bacterium]|nr:cyclic nucleotide-binding domain-containing protein [Rhodospirillales bacterium]
MSLDQEVEILRQIPIFANIDTAKLKLMCFASERLIYRAGQVLFSQGDVGDAAYIIIDGEAEVMVDSPGGPLTVAVLRRNDIVGEIAILCDVPRTATIKAATELVTLKITKDLFFRMVMDFPDMGVEIMRVLAHRLEQTTAQLREARTGSAG